MIREVSLCARGGEDTHSFAWRQADATTANYRGSLIGAMGSQLIDGLLDTGSDDTVLEEWVAAIIGVDLSQAVRRDVALVGRVQPVSIKYATARFRITDGLQEIYEWSAVVGFTPIKLRYPLFGYAGFLQFFNTEFLGDDCDVIVTPNKAFPGSVTPLTTRP